MVNSTINDNESASDGGGIYNSGDLSVENSTVSGNLAATSGGGILNSGTLLVVNSTIATNTADGNQDNVGAGGGIFTEDGNSTTLHNTIVAGNIRGTAAIADDLGDIGLSGIRVQAGSSYNVIGDAATSGGLTHDEKAIRSVSTRCSTPPVCRTMAARRPQSPCCPAVRRSMPATMPQPLS